MITIRNLQKTYQSNEVLKGLNLHVSKGDIYGFIGKNGAGKTTTLNIMTNLLESNGGQVTIDPSIKMGYLPEAPKYYDYMTAIEYMFFLGTIQKHDKEFIKSKTDELLTLVGLYEHRKKRISHFSRGMQQRLGIAAILLNDPDILLLDEPSSALDPQGRKKILDLMLLLKDKGKTIFFSTHILTDVEKVCNKIAILHEGKIIIEDELEHILDTPFHYVVTTKDLINDQKLIESIEFVKNVQLTGEQFIIQIDDDKNLFKALSLLPIHVESFVKHKVSLEEIFIKAVD